MAYFGGLDQGPLNIGCYPATWRVCARQGPYPATFGQITAEQAARMDSAATTCRDAAALQETDSPLQQGTPRPSQVGSPPETGDLPPNGDSSLSGVEGSQADWGGAQHDGGGWPMTGDAQLPGPDPTRSNATSSHRPTHPGSSTPPQKAPSGAANGESTHPDGTSSRGGNDLNPSGARFDPGGSGAAMPMQAKLEVTAHVEGLARRAVVMTALGAVEGMEEEVPRAPHPVRVRSFKGIPYAVPPVSAPCAS